MSRDRHFDFWPGGCEAQGTPGTEGYDLTPKSQGWGVRGVSQLLPVAPEDGVEVGVELRRGRCQLEERQNPPHHSCLQGELATCQA